MLLFEKLTLRDNRYLMNHPKDQNKSHIYPKADSKFTTKLNF